MLKCMALVNPHRRRFLLASSALAATGLTACAAGRGDPAERWPPIGAFVEVEGRRIHYVDKGRGAPVILLHGASGNLRDWTFHLADRIAQGRRVIAFDRPGLGHSARGGDEAATPQAQARILHAAAQALGVGPAIVVGHSWGGAAALAWGLDYPSDTRGLVTIGAPTHPWGGDAGALYELAATRLLGPIIAQIAPLVANDAFMAKQLTRIFKPQDPPEGYLDYIGGGLAVRPATVRANARDLSRLHDALEVQAKRYEGLQPPVEILHGLADEIVLASLHGARLATEAPRARLTLAEGVGHMMHHARPDMVLAAITRLDTAT